MSYFTSLAVVVGIIIGAGSIYFYYKYKTKKLIEGAITFLDKLQKKKLELIDNINILKNEAIDPAKKEGEVEVVPLEPAPSPLIPEKQDEKL